jgi:hypothetical protein
MRDRDYITDNLPRDPGDAEDIEIISEITTGEGAQQTYDVPVGDQEDPFLLEDPDEFGNEVDAYMQPAEELAQFDVNLADYLPETFLTDLATELMELYEEDKTAREPRDKQYAEGIQQTGFGRPAPGGADFPGASRVTHPLMGEATIQFAASATKELLPPDGPVRTKSLNDEDPTASKRAERKKRYMNWLLTTGCPEYYHEHDQLFPQLAIAGGGYIKLWWDAVEGLRCEFIDQSRVYLPATASGWLTARRRVIDYDLSEVAIQRRVRMGLYRQEPFEISAGLHSDKTATEEANAEIEGKEETGMNLDGTRRLHEFYVFYNMDGQDPLLIEQVEEGAEEDSELDQPSQPGWYIVTIDSESEEIASIYRNWDMEKFATRGEISEDHWVVPYGFIPWEGASNLGFAHILNGLSKGVTGAMRALHDAALINNQPTAVRLKGGGRKSGANITLSPTAVVEVDGMNVDDIRKAFMPMPFKGADPTLLQLLGIMVDAGKGIVSTAVEKVAEISSTAPVGTTVALIEQGSKVQSSIHARMHRSMAMELAIIHRLLRDNLQPGEVELDTGYEMITPEEFQGPLDVIPVSDPHIFAETQRYAIMAEVTKVAESPLFQQLNWNRDALARRLLSMLRVPNADELLPPEPDPEPTNAVDENAQMVNGAPQQVFPEQDHEAHLIIHFQFLASPMFGMNRIMAQTLIPTILQHIKDHLALYYVKRMGDALNAASGGMMPQIMEMDKAQGGDIITQSFAQIAGPAMQQMETALQAAPGVIEAAFAFMEKISVNDQVEVIKAQAEAMLKEAQASEIKAQVDNIKSGRQADREDLLAEHKIQSDAREAVRKEQELALKAEITEAELESKEAMKEEEIASREDIAEAQIAKDLRIARAKMNQPK